MKILLLSIVLAAAGYLTYTNHFRSAETPSPTPSPTPRLAPAGIHFSLERYSVVTESGVNALPAGTQVKALGEPQDGKLAVSTDSGLEFLVPIEILTNDLDVRDGVLSRIQKDLDKARANMDGQTAATNQRLEEQLRVSQQELQQLQLKLDELQLSRERAVANIELEVRSGKNVSLAGGPRASEIKARNVLAAIERAIKKTELAIEDLKLAIRREQMPAF